MTHETFAIINDQDQVVNHIIVDKDAPNFDEVMAGQLAHWSCVRYVETTETQPVIILDPSPEIWTTHTEETGFVLPKITDPNPPVIYELGTEPSQPVEEETTPAE